MLRAFISGGIVAIVSAIYPIGEAFPQEWSWYLNHDFLNPTGVNAYGYNSAYLHDIDQDDDLDLVVGQGDGTIQLYYNDGFPDVERWRLDDTYFAELSFDYAVVPSLGDFDGDDSLELVLGFKEWDVPANSLRVYRNRGSPDNPRWEEVSGFFNISTQFFSYHKFIDWDGDGDSELIVSVWEGWDTPYLFFRNIGSPGDPIWSLDSEMTAAMPTQITPCGIEGFDIADFNNDGFNDILLSYFVCDAGSEIGLYINNGTNDNPDYRHTNLWIAYGAGYASNITIGDLDGDNDLDFFVGGAFPPIYYHRNNGNAQSPAFDGDGNQRLGPFYIDGGEDLALLDRDNDGDLDMATIRSFWLLPIGRQILLWATYDNHGNLYIPDFRWERWFSWNLTDYTDLAVTAGDINGDGWEDLIFSIHGTLYTLRNVAGYEFEFDESFFWNLDYFSKHPELVDLDLDGDLDMLVVNLSSNQLTAFEFGSPEMPEWFHRPQWVDGLDLSATFARAANLNADALPDLVLEVDNHLKGYLNVGDNDDPSFLYVPEIFQDWQDFDIGYFNIADLDGDSDDDIILDNSGVILFLENQTPLAADEIGPLPDNAFILFNYPNPFNAETSIKFSLSKPSHVELAVYDLSGSKVKTIIDSYLEPGPHTVTWDGRNSAGQAVSSGVYFYTLYLDDISSSRRMLLLK